MGRNVGSFPASKAQMLGSLGTAALLALSQFLSLSLLFAKLFAKGPSAKQSCNENTDKCCSAKCFAACWEIIYANCCS